MLFCDTVGLLVIGNWRRGEGKYFSTKEGMDLRSVMSNWMVEITSLPCFSCSLSKFSFLLPTAITWIPFSIIRSARARPMPLVAPKTRTFLYGKDMTKRATDSD